MNCPQFQKTIRDYFKDHRRDFPWRTEAGSGSDLGELAPYHILVSEIMLQQTQADRVVSKYGSFIGKFPDFEALAEAALSDVLREWKGLGYNRRALNLRRLAIEVMEKHRGELPRDPEALIGLPGIGPGTAGSLLAFAFNIPRPFIETNIRTVFIHFFFHGREEVSDREIMPLIEKTLDRENPREWYYALMDYGVMLKKMHKNPSRKSVHYKKQSPFKGSARELRAQILHQIVLKPSTLAQIAKSLKRERKEVERHTNDLAKEGFVALESGMYRVKE